MTVGIPADLLRRRPDIRRAELQAAAQCAQIGFAKADLFPAFSLIGNVGTLATDIARAASATFSRATVCRYSVGPAVQWNILNYGQITNNVRVQDAKFQELLIDYQNTVLKAQQEVENGIATFIYSREQAVVPEEKRRGGGRRSEDRDDSVQTRHRRFHHRPDRGAEPLSGAEQPRPGHREALRWD